MKPPRLSSNELRIICTDRGEHTSIELALLVANTGDPVKGLDLTWLMTDAESDPTAKVESEESGALADIDRVEAGSAPFPPVPARPAFPRPRSRLPKGEIVRHTRADGGLTFEFPPCPKCKGQPRLIRAAKLAAFMRDAPGKMLDVSLIP